MILNLNKFLFRVVIILVTFQCCITLPVLIAQQKKTVIWPNPEIKFDTHATETDTYTKTGYTTKYSDKKIILNYIFNKGPKYHRWTQNPDVKICFNKKRKRFFDLAQYSTIEISIRTKNMKSLKISLEMATAQFTRYNRKSGPIILTRVISVNEYKQHYEIPISEFRIPYWWLDKNRLSKYDTILKKDFSRITGISLGSPAAHPFKKRSSLIIKKIILKKSYVPLLYGNLVFCALYFSLFIVYIFNLKKSSSRTTNMLMPYKKIDIKSRKHDKKRLLLQYLEKNYLCPDLSVTFVSKETDIPLKEIPLIIKKTFNLTFPQYLHKIRLKKAQELLIKTKIKIIDIAYKVGYNSISNFNFHFKQEYGTSPSEYRNTFFSKKSIQVYK